MHLFRLHDEAAGALLRVAGGHATRYTRGRMSAYAGKAALARLKAGHGSLVVDRVERLVVVHHLE